MMLLSGVANCCGCLKSFSEHLQLLCCPIFPRNSDVFALWLCFQMANRVQNQVVRLTRCLDVPGHTAMLVRVMIETGYRWYPEYTVEEQFRDFNQSQYSAPSGYFLLILDLPSPFTVPMDSGLLLRWLCRMLPIP